MRVDFYISNDNRPQARFELACRILDKAYQNQVPTVVNTSNDQHAELMNELLWTFRDTSFIPHARVEESLEPPPLILIGVASSLTRELLVNLADEIPNHHRDFSRIIEIVAGSDAEKQTARQHYRFYQQQGFTLNTHQIN